MKKYKIFTFGYSGGNIAQTLVRTNQSLYEEQGNILYHFNTDAQYVARLTSLKNKYLIGSGGLRPGSSIEYAKRVFDDDKNVRVISQKTTQKVCCNRKCTVSF
ncbi:MAG: hypothetical protein LBI15_02970 [Dysgonamonadaceae bacterium]|nr:hypothetical protein [Dysgonamonadaceae bacterium]